MSNERGLTLLEVALMLTVTAALMAALTPALAATIADARLVKADTDMAAIRDALNQALTDTGFVEFKITGTGAGTQVELLVSDGDTPLCDSATATCGNVADSWVRPVDNTGGLTDFLERHLVTNNPRGNSANDYPTPNWKGAYMTAPIDPDPWGNRYGVNAVYFNEFPTNVHVLTAGPDETVASAWGGAPLVGTGDDRVLLVQP